MVYLLVHAFVENSKDENLRPGDFVCQFLHQVKAGNWDDLIRFIKEEFPKHDFLGLKDYCHGVTVSYRVVQIIPGEMLSHLMSKSMRS